MFSSLILEVNSLITMYSIDPINQNNIRSFLFFRKNAIRIVFLMYRFGDRRRNINLQATIEVDALADCVCMSHGVTIEVDALADCVCMSHVVTIEVDALADCVCMSHWVTIEVDALADCMHESCGHN